MKEEQEVKHEDRVRNRRGGAHTPTTTISTAGCLNIVHHVEVWFFSGVSRRYKRLLQGIHDCF
jgi:hypothetical protein